jgi:hypothetical protein
MDAVEGFRVITQNYKAEYQDASSGIIVATTKEGGNEWHGSFFGFGETPDLIRRSFFQEQSGLHTPNYRRLQAGGDVGGPLIVDKLHVYAAYELSFQDRASQVKPGGSSSPLLAQLNPSQYAGNFIEPFREHLGFIKLNYDVAPNHALEFTTAVRHETDIEGFGNLTDPTFAYSTAENRKNDVVTGTLKYTYSPGRWLNESAFDYQWYQYNPSPIDNQTPGSLYRGVVRIGGRDTYQNFRQDRFSFRDQLSYSGLNWLGSHVIKGGANFDYLDYKIDKSLNGNPFFEYNVDTSITVPVVAHFGVGNPVVNVHNNMIGAFIQDDWSPISRLTLNIGVRWDFETNQFNNGYVTPTQIRDSLQGLRNSAGQLLIKNSYFTNGNRAPFLGEWQPRVGFSYDAFNNGKTTFFGGFGVYYDRDNFNSVLDEVYRRNYGVYTFNFSSDGAPRNGLPTIKWQDSYKSRAGLLGLIASGQAPLPEVFLIDSHSKPPYSSMFSGGVHQALGPLVATLQYNGVRSYNGLTYTWGNRDWTAPGQPFVQLHSYSDVLLSNNTVKSWYDAVTFKLEKPFTAATTWGGSVSYTSSNASQTGGDLFSLDFPTPDGYGKHSTPTDEPNVFLVNAVGRLPFGFVLSGIGTFTSGYPYTWFECIANKPCVTHYYGKHGVEHDFLFFRKAFGYETVDARIAKSFTTFRGQNVQLLVDMFNIFNDKNLGCYNGFYNADPKNAERFGQATCSGLDNQGRSFQLGLRYAF